MHYTRKGQEWLLKTLNSNKDLIKVISDYALMMNINEILIEKGCIPYSDDELEMELN